MAHGFLDATRDILTPAEIDHLVFGAKLITFEQAIRFLGDYLNGDVYYKIHRPDHNLDRARTQIKLVAEIEQHSGYVGRDRDPISIRSGQCPRLFCSKLVWIPSRPCSPRRRVVPTVSSCAPTCWRAGLYPQRGHDRARPPAAANRHECHHPPRVGDFCYSDVEFETMKLDIALCKQVGVDGVVIGLLHPDGSVDVERMRALIELARPLSVTCHRAFDVSRDPIEALETLIGLGVDRILTSGQEPSPLEGLELIAELVRRAGERVIIMPGGVSERTVGRIVAGCGAREVHGYLPVTVEGRMIHRNPRRLHGRASCGRRSTR